MKKYSFESELWLYPSESAAWCFATVPQDISAKIKSSVKLKRGFGSIKVRATLAKQVWETSIFPNSKDGTYLLPVKKQIRQKTDLSIGDIVKISLEII